jgi:hypothetical protein
MHESCSFDQTISPIRESCISNGFLRSHNTLLEIYCLITLHRVASSGKSLTERKLTCPIKLCRTENNSMQRN